MRYSKPFLPMAFLCFALVAGPSLAAGLNVLGFEDMSCAAWVKSKGDAELRNSYVIWARGFLTGHNYALPGQQVSTISSATVEVHLNEYCAGNSRGSFSEGVMRLSDEFSGRNQPIKK